MRCPRCHREVPDGAECAACGVVVAKFLVRQQQVEGRQPTLGSTGDVAGSAAMPRRAGRSVRLRRISDRHLVGLCAQLGRMLEAGLSVAEALRLAAQHARGFTARALDAIREAVERGQTLADAASEQPGLFPESAQVLLRAGEVTGSLPAALRALSSSAELRLEIRRRLLRACIYPFVLFTLVFFVPKAHLLFTVGWAAYLKACLLPYLATLAALFVVVYLLPMALAASLGRDASQRIVRGIPLLRGLFRLASTVRFARHLAVAIDAGLDMGSALRLAARSTGDTRWIVSLASSERALQQGATLHQALAQTGLFDDELLLTTAAGERAGGLVDALGHHARLVEATLGHRIQVAVQLLAVVVLLATYFFVAQTVVSEFSDVLGGAGQQVDELLKEVGGESGSGLEELLKQLGGDEQQVEQLLEELGRGAGRDGAGR